ncbi:MAG: hypothetical protein VXY94_03240 [Planctomycetota bacterium]|nr:hypothetical protein [Planctomycetota bacterium]MEC8735261.1 hypothetical protein [Planctomycetota bacterium]MEC9158333.1 hypothetical protein [Planctomycetota bacterium]MEC9234030.1 hypothetical protein [Planctomycetota bacterium]MED5507849.1 hypothetical protein [Planctomycetota bacterium]
MNGRLASSAVAVAMLATTTSLGTEPVQDPDPDPAPTSSELPPEVVDDRAATAVLARHLAAMGGADRRDGITSTRSRASLELGGTATEFRLLTRREGGFLVRQAIPGLGELEIGFDGTTGWRRDTSDGKATPITARQAEEFRRSFDFQALVRNLDRRFSGARMQPVEEVDSTPCDVVLVEDGEERLKLLFDQATGLVRAIEIVDAEQRLRRRVVIQSWADEPGPFRWVRDLRIEQPRSTLTARYSSVTFDDVAEASFEPPPELERARKDVVE